MLPKIKIASNRGIEYIPLADAEESIKRNGLIFDSNCSNICNLAVCRI